MKALGLSENKLWICAAALIWGASLLFVAFGSNTTLDNEMACGRTGSAALGSNNGYAGMDECQGAAQGELVAVPMVLTAIIVGTAFGLRHLVRWSRESSQASQVAVGPHPPTVPPSHLHWDGHRWFRWDGTAWVPDSDEGSF